MPAKSGSRRDVGRCPPMVCVSLTVSAREEMELALMTTTTENSIKLRPTKEEMLAMGPE